MELNNEQYYGGKNNYELYDNEEDDDVDDVELTDENDFFYGGAKEEDESSYKVARASIGSYEGGRFISKTTIGAAKKAATAIIRHIDLESGVKVQKEKKINPKGKQSAYIRPAVPINQELKKKYGKKPVSMVHFVIYRTDRNNLHKYFAYTAERVKIDEPKEFTRGGVPFVLDSKIIVKKAELPEDLAEANKEILKKQAAKKRKEAAKAKKAEAGEEKVKKPRKAKKADGEEKVKKPRKAKKADGEEKVKKPRKSKKAEAENENKAPTLMEIIRSLSRSPEKEQVVEKKQRGRKAAAEKKPKAPKKAAAEKKPKAAPKKAAAEKKPRGKKVGGGYCSFF